MKKLIFLAIHRRGLMFVLFAFIAVVGYYSWTRPAIDAYPDIADTTVQIVTQVPGLAAEEIEQQITIPIERAVNGLPIVRISGGMATLLPTEERDLFHQPNAVPPRDRPLMPRAEYQGYWQASRP